MITNFHTHVYPDNIAKKAIESVSGYYGIKMEMDGSIQSLLTDCQKAGIDRAVVLGVATVPSQVQSINNYVSSLCNEHKELVGFGTIHSEMENPEAEIERMISLGLKGIKIHPDTQHINIDEEKMFKVYDMILGKLPILFHCGDYRYGYSRPERLARVLDNFPGLTVIAAHFGGWSLWDLAAEYLVDRDCYLDCSSSTMYLGRKRSRELIHEYGAERILFGTDFPMWNAFGEIGRIKDLNLSAEETELIMNGNASRILGE